MRGWWLGDLVRLSLGWGPQIPSIRIEPTSFHHFHQPTNTNLTHTTSAASAGALASWITNPVDLVRLRLQVQRGSEAKTATAEAGAAAVVGGGGGGKGQPPSAREGGAGPGGGGGEGKGKKTGVVYRNTLDGLRKVYGREGLAGLFKGSGARIAFHTPSTMISMSLYDELKKLFHHAMG